MPLYEYQCDDCGKRFERIQKFSDPPVDKCPSCAGVVRKLISSPAIQFKGSGWYITDYARKGEASGGSGSTDAGKDSSASKDTSGAANESSTGKEASKETSKAASSDSAKPAAEKATPGSKT